MLAANWTPQLIDWAGGISGLAIAGQHSTVARWNEIVAFDPELIVILPCGFDLPRTVAEARVLRNLTGWSQVTAVRNRRVAVVDGNRFFNCPSPRLVDSLELLAWLLHPSLFEPPTAKNAGLWQWLE